MTKRVILTIIGLILLIGVLGGIKIMQIRRMEAHGDQFVPPPEPVNTARVNPQSWEKLLHVVGSLDAVQGVTVTAELAGKVVRIHFEPGTKARAGDLLLQQDTSSEEAQLRAAEAALSLTKLTLERADKLREKKITSQSEYDAADAQFKQAQAQADNIRTMIRKKTIRAPFSGGLGIRLVNLGQIIKEGDPIVSLQSIDPIFVNFSLPQQQLADIRPGFVVRVMTDAFPGTVVAGKVTAINPQVDAATRSVKVQATVANPKERLRPGMFVKVAVVMPERENVLVVPSTAVLYAPYSDSVFVLEEQSIENKSKPVKVVRQQFVKLGEKHGDFVIVVSGLRPNETVVSTGVFKLRNGQTVTVDNTLKPDFRLAPKPEDG
ncbi:MAG: efflux RND transporter periplasmic adaptor subunit [Desulfobacterales bacterium]|nr:efflux RND transporter periplasmic adaptor subunit [Desulfobacterales bacterium]